MKRKQLLIKKSADGEGFISLYELSLKFVTWRSNKSTPEDTYWGHYYDRLEDAMADFEGRE